MPRQRARTRARLIEAAFEQFAAHGFGNVTIEQVCQAAGHTRGAFYSNFSTLDELFLALYEWQTERMARQVTQVLHALTPYLNGQRLDAAVDRGVSDFDYDPRWFVLNAEINLYALRKPEVAEQLAQRRAQLRQTIGPLLARATEGLDLPAELATPDRLARTAIALYDGGMVQILLEPGNAALHSWFRGLFVAVLSAGA